MKKETHMIVARGISLNLPQSLKRFESTSNQDSGYQDIKITG